MFCPAVSLNKFTPQSFKDLEVPKNTPILGEQKITPINLFVQSLGTLICIFGDVWKKNPPLPPQNPDEKKHKTLIDPSMVLNLMAKVVNITNPTKKQQIHRICQTTMNVPGVPPGGLNSSIPPRSFIIHLLNNLSSGVGFTYCQSKIVKNKYVHIIFEWKLSIHRYKYINTHIHFNIYIYINISLHLRKYKYTYSIHFSPQKNTKKPLAHFFHSKRPNVGNDDQHDICFFFSKVPIVNSGQSWSQDWDSSFVQNLSWAIKAVVCNG